MAAYDLEEQEQIAQLKAWWAQYGNLVMTILLALALGFAGWQMWNRHRNTEFAEASALYFDLQRAVADDDAAQVRKIAGEIISKHGNTVQAQLGAMLSAGVQFRKNDLDNARPQIEWAADKGKDTVLRDLARLRLAAVLIQQGAIDEALLRLQPVPEGALRARFEDLRGDAFASQGRNAQARTAWKAAFGALDDTAQNASLRSVIRIKLDSLEG
ncbi:MAG: tetratricopeptide repeat protein [Azoarcus sp.]|jgi:predicted negative regulator of RcsB-dependent stress response|nr:tetratricopeptide repeat protein [Azoarcus sp.]